MCKFMTLLGGAGPTLYHLLGTLWVSFTTYGERVRTGELRTVVVATRRASDAERKMWVSIFATEDAMQEKIQEKMQ